MIKKLLCILLTIILLIPIPMRLKDGGTIVYRAMLYEVHIVHRINLDYKLEEGIIVKILGIEIYHSVE